ncbi:MAG TPA: type II secretion system protein, partial [Myxococcota bacterium]|nr:type II secretion system protein [Myxococcota bacterium]
MKRGFTLLEVMVALALLALSFTALLMVQGRATSLALEARTLSIATQLLRVQLVECKQKVQKVISSVSDFKEEGNFSEFGYEQFTWECHAPKFNM